MSTVAVDAQVFAKLVGRYPDRDVLLFEVSGIFLADAEDNRWSEPCHFRFVRREGARVELELHTIDLPADVADRLGDPNEGRDD